MGWTGERRAVEKAILDLVEKSQRSRHLESKAMRVKDTMETKKHRAAANAYEYAIGAIRRHLAKAEREVS
jgi:hypothetical protein